MQKSTDTDIKLLHQFIPAGIFFMYSVHYQLSSVKAEKKKKGGEAVLTRIWSGSVVPPFSSLIYYAVSLHNLKTYDKQWN